MHRLTPAVRRRLLFLLAGNALLLGLIFLLLKEGASFRSVLRQAGPDMAPVILAGLGLTGIIAAGAIDLSLGAVLALSASVFGILVHHQAPPWLAFAACFALPCAALGWNGVVIRVLGIPPIIVTLAGLAAYRGLALIVSDLGIDGFGGNIPIQKAAYQAPGKEWGGLLLAGGVVLAIALEAGSRTYRSWLALGNSPEACRLNGMDPARILLGAYLAGGVFLGLASLVFATRVQSIEPSRIAAGFELEVIGAVVLGGANIFGGEGSYLGTLLGALFLYLASLVLTYAGVSAYYEGVITGGLILVVIGLDCALHRRRKLLEELS